MLIQKRLARYHEPRRAKAALLGVILDKSRLNRGKFAVRGEPFDGSNVFPLGLQSQHRTGIDWFAPHYDGAGPAGCAIADFLGSCEIQIVS
jgi:hypothetical protein